MHTDVDVEDVLAQTVCLFASFSNNRWSTIRYKLSIYSQNLTLTSSSMYLHWKIIYNILILPILIKSCFKNLSITGCYNPIGQIVPAVNYPIIKVATYAYHT